MTNTDRLKVRALAREIVQQYNGPGIMLMIEAITQARKELGL